MNMLSALIHNGRIVSECENNLNELLEADNEHHKSYIYIENPDGTKIRLQKGFAIKSYEIAF